MATSNESNKGMDAVAETIKVLPEGERDVYHARYVLDEDRSTTCDRLGLTFESYDRLLKNVMVALRRGIAKGSREAS